MEHRTFLRWGVLSAAIVSTFACSEYSIEEIQDRPLLPKMESPPSQHNPFTRTACEQIKPIPAAEMAIDDNCLREPTIGLLDPVLEWRSSETWAYETFPIRTNSVTTPVVGQLTDDNGDGVIDDSDTPDIVLSTYHTYHGLGSLRVVSGDGEGVHWSFENITIDGERFQASTRGGAAIGDLDGDGRAEVVTVSAEGHPMAFSNTGELLWIDSTVDVGRGTYPAIADMDGDGKAEVMFGRHFYDADGELIGRGDYGTGFTIWTSAYGLEGNRGMSFAADLDLDGQLEVVAGDSLYHIDGTLLARTGGPDGFSAVGNFDDDPMGELVVVDGASQRVFLYDYDGTSFTQKWAFPIPGGGGTKYNGGPPTIADFDGDGLAEIGVAGSDDYFVLNHDGTYLWSNPITDLSSAITGSSVFDFDKDGAAEVVYADEHDLWILDGKTGELKARWSDHVSRTQLEYPVIADVDGDGHTEIILVSSNDTQMGEWSGISVLGSATNSWAAARPVWNQHAYSITNVGDAGEIPSDPEANWTRFNTFRAGHVDPDLTHYLADVIAHRPQYCLDECANDRTLIWVDVGNGGLQTTDTFEVAVVLRDSDGSTQTLHSTLLSAVDSGEGLLIGPITVDKAEWLSGQIEVIVDPDTTLDECDATNNVLVLPEWPCEP